MMYKIEFDDEAKKTIAKLKKSNPQTFKKVTKLLEDIAMINKTSCCLLTYKYGRQVTAFFFLFMLFLFILLHICFLQHYYNSRNDYLYSLLRIIAKFAM